MFSGNTSDLWWRLFEKISTAWSKISDHYEFLDIATFIQIYFDMLYSQTAVALFSPALAVQYWGRKYQIPPSLLFSVDQRLSTLLTFLTHLNSGPTY